MYLKCVLLDLVPINDLWNSWKIVIREGVHIRKWPLPVLGPDVSLSLCAPAFYSMNLSLGEWPLPFVGPVIVYNVIRNT